MVIDLEEPIHYGLAVLLKLPTGQNSIKRDGQRLDEHLQPGTGSYDWQVGGLLARSIHAVPVFSSIYYRHSGTNRFGYHYGNSFLYNLGATHPLARQISSSSANQWTLCPLGFRRRSYGPKIPAVG